MIKKFREKLKQGVVGCFSKTEDPAIIETMGYAGADFVIIDLEHGPNTIRSAQNLIRAAQISGLFPIIRVKEENKGKNIVVLLADGGERYLSTELFKPH